MDRWSGVLPELSRTPTLAPVQVNQYHINITEYTRAIMITVFDEQLDNSCIAVEG